MGGPIGSTWLPTKKEPQAVSELAQGETGAVLILALIFMVVTALIVTGLTAWSGNDIRNVGNLKTGRSALYASDAATQAAIWNIRYSYPSSATPGFCPSSSGTNTHPLVLDNESIDVFCNFTSINEGSTASRVVNVSAYPAAQCGATSCNGIPFVQAEVTFNDFSSLDSNDCKPAGNQTTCGTGQTVIFWEVQHGLT